MQLILVCITAPIARISTTNMFALVFRSMGVIALLVGMQDRFSNELHGWFLGKTIQNYVANTRITGKTAQPVFRNLESKVLEVRLICLIVCSSPNKATKAFDWIV